MPRRKQATPPDLAAARKALERWRATRTQRAIPEALWETAASLAREHGVHRTSRALRLNYDSLRRRVDGARRATRSTQGAPVFAEVVRSGTDSRDCRPVADGECFVELENARGDRLRVRTRDMPNLDALAASLWNGHRR